MSNEKGTEFWGTSIRLRLLSMTHYFLSFCHWQTGLAKPYFGEVQNQSTMHLPDLPAVGRFQKSWNDTQWFCASILLQLYLPVDRGGNQ
ncbi:MAG: hypothetical protein D8M61_15435 [Ignavibacteriae bacterium]|nr:hypothetical protein [Ignavibacteriota bacterium]